MSFAALHESAYGTKRTSRHVCYLSAFGGKADIICSLRFVRCWPKADMGWLEFPRRSCLPH